MKIKVKITDDDDNIQQYDVSDSPHFNCILNEHYDNRGRLDGGIIIDGGVIRGHIDPKGEEGYPGVVGITDYGYDDKRL